MINHNHEYDMAGCTDCKALGDYCDDCWEAMEDIQQAIYRDIDGLRANEAAVEAEEANAIMVAPSLGEPF